MRTCQSLLECADIQRPGQCIVLFKWILLWSRTLFYLEQSRYFRFCGAIFNLRGQNVKNISKASILFVDDEPCMREVMAMILTEEGYEVSTATDGFDALAQLRTSVPDLIISDLQMPRMSGVEFLAVVRHRFPAIPVIAISGASDTKEFLPADVMADAFYPKCRCQPDELMRTVSNLIHLPLARPTNYHPASPSRVQTARRIQDASGRPAWLLTCSECLRAFSWVSGEMNGAETQQAHCRFCMTPVNFVNDVELPSSAVVMGSCIPPRMSAA
jgi:CheY-like chemotaxis protein